MATVKLLYIGAVGPKEVDVSADDFEIAGIKMNGTIDMNSNQFSNLAAASGSGQALAYGQASGQLAGLSIITNPLTMGSQQITGLADGSAADHAINLSQLEEYAINGAQRKELLLHENQLDNTEGVLAAVALTMVNNPTSGDTITITDGTTTRTYGAGTGGDVQYTIGATVADTMANLASAIQGDGSAAWGAYFSTDLDSIDTDGVVAIIEDDNDGTASEIYGTWSTQADCQIVDYSGELDYTKKTTSNLPSSDPASTNFGIRRTQSALVPGELHYVENNDVNYAWDDDANQWNATSGSSSIPDATSASGGGIKGKVTFDRDYGLLVTTGIARISLATNKGLGFDGAGDLQGIADTTAGMEITASGFAVDLAATNPCLEFSSGDLQFQINGTTLEKTATGARVKGLPSLFEINGVAVGATVTAPNLDDLTDGSNADALHTHSAVSSNRIEDEVTAEEALAFADPIEWGTTNDQIRECQASVTARVDCVGVVEEAGGISASGTGTVVFFGPATVLSGATVGTRYYVGSSGGLVAGLGSLGSGDHIIFVGTAINATQLFVQPQYIGEKA